MLDMEQFVFAECEISVQGTFLYNKTFTTLLQICTPQYEAASFFVLFFKLSQTITSLSTVTDSSI